MFRTTASLIALSIRQDERRAAGIPMPGTELVERGETPGTLLLGSGRWVSAAVVQ